MNTQQEGSGEGRTLETEHFESLSKLRDLDQEIADMRRHLDRRPKELDAKRRDVEKQEQAVKTAAATITAAQKRIDQKTLESESIEADVTKLESQLFNLKTNEEFEAMKSQIRGRKEKDDVLQTEVLELMEVKETLTRDLASEEERLAKTKQALEAAEDRSRGALADEAKEVESKEGERTQILESLPADVRALYLEGIRRSGSGVAFMIEGICKGCDTQVTMAIQGVVAGSRLACCPHCSRVLVPSV